MLKAIKKFLKIQEKTIWTWDYHELARVPVGAAIIDNAGVTEGWAALEWVKNHGGTWSNGASLVSDDYFTMPFAVVKKSA